MVSVSLRTHGSFVLVAVVGLLLSTSFAAPSYGQSFVDDFSSDPFAANWSIDADCPNGDPNQFAYDGQRQALLLHFDSSLDTVRARRSLGAAVTENDTFEFSGILTYDSVTAPEGDFMQIPFGLSNSSNTGCNRTGTYPYFDDDDVHDYLEIGYFPNPGWGCPCMTTTIIGTGDPNAPATDYLNHDWVEEAIMPLHESVAFWGRFSADTGLLTYTVSTGIEGTVDVDDTPDPLCWKLWYASRGFPPAEFVVDEYSISSYRDYADWDPSSVSLVADVAYEEVSFAKCAGLDDGDCDGDVDLQDFFEFQMCFSGSPGPAALVCAAKFDSDGDGDVDLQDFLVFQASYTGPQ